MIHPLVMKFGGTSVADANAIGRVVEIVRAAAAYDAPVVVVSAMAGVTDQLLALAASAEAGDDGPVSRGIDDLRERHAQAARELLGSAAPPLLAMLHAQIEDLRAVLRAVAILREASPRSLDTIAATGELLGSRIVAAALDSHGVRTAWVDPRRAVITDAEHTRASPLGLETEAAVRQHVLPHTGQDRAAVVGGFVGATRSGVTTTLGRGGSDYSASLVGAALGAREIQIWTDVDGMLTADPRLVANPSLVSHLSFAEASELAYFGAKVLHPSTILPAVDRNIPVRILNTHRPESAGTLITRDQRHDGRPLAAIACKRGLTVIDITSSRMLMAHGFLQRLFAAFERHRTAVDVVTTSEVSVSVTIDDARRLEEVVGALREFAEVTVEPEMAILCAVGDTLRAEPHLAVRIIAALDGFALRMVSQAASRRNLTVVLREQDAARAMSRLHAEFFG
jgi:aspartate kinase